MDPAGNNDFTILFRWKELAVSLNLTVKESKQGELFIHEMDTTEGKNWVPFQRRDLVRIKILKKNASSGRGYKQTGPVINESIENATFSTIPRFIVDYIFPPRMAPAASSRTYNFAKIISVAHLPRIFIANTLTDRFHGPWKIPTTRTYHFIEQNILDWIIVKPVLRRVEQTARFNCSQKITNSPQSFDSRELCYYRMKKVLSNSVPPKSHSFIMFHYVISR